MDSSDSTTPIHRLVKDTLHGKFDGDILVSGTDAFDDAVVAARANNNCAPSAPALVLVPVSATDVQAAVRCAAEGERRSLWGAAPMAVRGGGHSELCVVDEGVTVLMHRMATVEFDVETRTVTVGPGADFGMIIEAGRKHNLVMPTGTAPSVGLGAVLCGGVGRLSRLIGLSCDNVLEVDVVLADGTIRTIGDADGSCRTGGLCDRGDEDRDLLWAIRGCGCQFGIVTRLVARVFEIKGARHCCGRKRLMSVPAASVPPGAPAPSEAAEEDRQAALALLVRAEAAARSLPPPQSADLVIGVAPPAAGDGLALMLCTMACALVGPGLDSAFTASAQEALHFAAPPFTCRPSSPAAGSAHDGDATDYWPIPFEPLTAPAPAAAPEAATGGQLAPAVADGNLQTSSAILSYVRQVFVDELGPRGLELLVRSALSAPSRHSSVILQHGGGCVRQPPDGANRSCIGARRWEYSVLFMALWEPTDDKTTDDQPTDDKPTEGEDARTRNMAWADRGWRAMVDSGLATGVYIVDTNPLRRPPAVVDEEVALAYGASLDKLRELKHQHDPSNLFRAGWPLLPRDVRRPATRPYVRRMRPSDLAACAAIEVQSYPRAVVEGVELFARELEQNPSTCWVAERGADDGGGAVLMGYAVSMPARTSDCPLELHAHDAFTPPDADGQEGRTLYLHDLAVATSERKAGVGTLLLRRVTEHARETAMPSVTLTAVCGGASYWLRHGFAPVDQVSTAARERLRSYPDECGEVRMMRRPVSSRKATGQRESCD